MWDESTPGYRLCVRLWSGARLGVGLSAELIKTKTNMEFDDNCMHEEWLVGQCWRWTGANGKVLILWEYWYLKEKKYINRGAQLLS